MRLDQPHAHTLTVHQVGFAWRYTCEVGSSRMLLSAGDDSTSTISVVARYSQGFRGPSSGSVN